MLSTKYKVSALLFPSRVLTVQVWENSLAFVHSALFFSILPYGLPRLSRAFSGFCRDRGTFPSSIMPRRKSTILSMYWISNGHSSSQAPQVVQDQISSSELCRASRRG